MIIKGCEAMTISHYLGLLGGLALFLFGMELLSEGLTEGLGERLEIFLLKLTNHKWKAIGVGTLLTCLIQSSSAMSVILIGFLNAHIMSLKRAIWVMMGANIGTTITGQMIALDIGMFAPLLAFVGVCLYLISHGIKHLCGQVMMALGLLFMGLEMMAQSMLPLQHSSTFVNALMHIQNPIWGVCIGMLFTALIQSSSASIGILQILASKQLISFHQAVYLILGFDLGTCITGFLASLKGSRNGKRLALFHFLFNVVGAISFLIISQMIPLIDWIAGWTPLSPLHQIANMHTFYNMMTTFIVLLCEPYLIHTIQWIYPYHHKK